MTARVRRDVIRHIQAWGCRFAREENGWVSVYSIFFLLSVLAIGSVAVDYSHAETSKSRLYATVDAAALASVWSLPDLEAVEATAASFVEKNMPASHFGTVLKQGDVQIGVWDADTRTFTQGANAPNAVRVIGRQSSAQGHENAVRPLVAGIFGFDGYSVHAETIVVRGADICETPVEPLLGALSDNLFYFDDGNRGLNWQGATKGFKGDVAVNGLVADQTTSGSVPYEGTIKTNANSIGAWQDIVDDNSDTSSAVTGQSALINALSADFHDAMADLGARDATAGFEDMSSKDLDGFTSQNGVPETFIINITSDLKMNAPIYISGDADDIFVMRWDDDLDAAGYQGEVKFSGGGGVIPAGDLGPGNLVNLAGKLNASGGGSTPAEMVPYVSQLPGTVNGGGFFTGYWLTTGDPEKSFESASLSNAIFVGGWYTSAVKLSMTSGTSGVYASPAPAISAGPCKMVSAATAVMVR